MDDNPEEFLEEEFDGQITQPEKSEDSPSFVEALLVSLGIITLFGGIVLSPAIAYFFLGFERAIIVSFVAVLLMFYFSL